MLSRRRTLQFSATMHAMRREARLHRPPVPQRSVAAAPALRHTGELASARGYNRSAIMSLALAEARYAGAHGSRLAWRRLISTELASAWIRARQARAAVVGT